MRENRRILDQSKIIKSSPTECETCKNGKYQDGSDEMVSFKSADAATLIGRNLI